MVGLQLLLQPQLLLLLVAAVLPLLLLLLLSRRRYVFSGKVVPIVVVELCLLAVGYLIGIFAGILQEEPQEESDDDMGFSLFD